MEALLRHQCAAYGSVKELPCLCSRGNLARMPLFRIYLRCFASLVLILSFIHSVWVIMVPGGSVGMYQQENELKDERFVIEKLMNNENERKIFLDSIPCIKRFLVTHIEETGRISFITVDEEGRDYYLEYSLVTSLRDHFAFFKHSTDIDFEISQLATSTIILMANASSLQDDFYILEPCDRGCPFITVLINSFEDEESFLEQADSIVHSMWSRRISLVIILARVENYVLAAGSLTYQPGKRCTPSSPVILDKCGEEESWGKLKEIKTPEMNGCILKIAYFDEPPYVITVNNSEYLMGFEGNLTEAMMKDQRVERERVYWNDNTTYAEQVEMYLYNEVMADLVIGRILQQSHEDIGYSVTYDMLKVVWVVPKVPNVSLKGLIQPFDPYIWAAIGGTLLLGALFRIFLSRDLSCLDIFALIIGVSTARQPDRVSSKILFISWSIFGVFLTQVYVDSLADQLINVSDLKIETMKSLMSSSFKIGGTAAFASLFNNFEDTDELLSQITEKFVIFDQRDYIRQFDDLLEGRNSSFALVIVLNSSRSDAIETEYAYTMTTDVVCSFPLALAAWKGFPYLRQINDKIHDYIDLGLFDFLLQLSIAKEQRAMLFKIAQHADYKSQLHLQQFIPAFLLVIIGFSGGLLFFVLEVVLYPSKLLE